MQWPDTKLSDMALAGQTKWNPILSSDYRLHVWGVGGSPYSINVMLMCWRLTTLVFLNPLFNLVSQFCLPRMRVIPNTNWAVGRQPTNWYPSGMGLASTRVGGLYVFSCLLVGGYHNGFSYKKKLKLKPVPWTDLVLIDCNISGSLAGKCKYDCQQSGLCFVRYVGPQRPGKTTVSISS